MTFLELGVIAGGLVLGYWAVSTFLFPTRAKSPEANSQSERRSESAAPPRRAAEPAWNEVLLVSTTASSAEIRDAYRRLISQYHPDKVGNLGPELRELATRKSQEITTAYAQAMRVRGEQP